jgi:hypothetical protein
MASATPAPSTLTARVYVSQGESYSFRELQTGVLPTPPTTAVCFSGGGTRSLSATQGQLRGLIAAGLLPKAGYISCVSGGSWAATAFTYYDAGAQNDAEFLGPVTAPGAITAAGLQQLSPSCLGYTATQPFRSVLFKLLDDKSVPRDEVWIRAVGQVFFAPFGLYDPGSPAYFSLDAATVASIVERNPALAGAAFQTVRSNGVDAPRPFLVLNSTLIWPVDDLRHENRVGFEYTPLYVGSPYLLKIGYKPLLGPPVYRTVGGGFLEPFAYGCPAPVGPPDSQGCVAVLPPPRPFTLTDASGTSSAAYGALFDEVDAALSPHVNYWPVTGAGGTPTFNYAFGDGGNLENYGLIPMLLRGVRRIVVFINTETKLNLGYSPSATNPPSASDLDDDLPPLFGVKVKEFLHTGNPFPHNQVFDQDDFATVVVDLQEAKKAGGPAVALTELTVQPNPWWGLPGGWNVQICWVYLDRVADWEQQLPADLQAQIQEGNEPTHPKGPFVHFPNYKTIDEDAWDIVQLTAPQVNLLADLTCWTVSNSPDVQQVLAGT